MDLHGPPCISLLQPDRVFTILVGFGYSISLSMDKDKGKLPKLDEL